MAKKTNRKVNRPRVYFLSVASLLVIVGAVSYVFVSTNFIAKQPDQNTSQSDIKGYDAYAGISRDDIQLAGTMSESAWEVNNPYYGYDKYPVAALVHIDSIDGGRVYSPIFEQYVYPQTIGKLTVREVYKGDVKPGQQLHYSRLGGIVTYDEYWNTLNPQQQDKMLHLNNGKKPEHKEYVKKMFMDDIDIEVGKDYVVFLLPQTYKDDSRHYEYFIPGGQRGLREVKGSGDNITVLNNDTKKWDSLDNVVKLNK